MVFGFFKITKIKRQNFLQSACPECKCEPVMHLLAFPLLRQLLEFYLAKNCNASFDMLPLMSSQNDEDDQQPF